MNTKISYLYRDAENNKVHNECIVCGEISDKQKEAILSSLDEGQYFIPSKVGLPEKQFDEYDPELDHPWFELGADSFDDTDFPSTVPISVTELTDSFARRAGRWEEAEADQSRKPYVVTITEVSKRKVVVWADGCQEAEEKANNLWNESRIVLDASDFADSEFSCTAVADEEDLRLLEQFGEAAETASVVMARKSCTTTQILSKRGMMKPTAPTDTMSSGCLRSGAKTSTKS